MNPECISATPVDVAISIARNPRRSFYRERCVKVLRRYFNVCAEVGRVPSMLGREIQVSQARVSYRRPSAFEDGVIFAIDIERCLDQLDSFEQGLIVRLVFQEHSEEEAARLLNCCRETISRRLPHVLDKLSRILRQRNLLFRWKRRRPVPETTVSINASEETATYSEAALIGSEDVISDWGSRLPGANRATSVVPNDYLEIPVEILCQEPGGLSINACV
jgi:hypothetical protein